MTAADFAKTTEELRALAKKIRDRYELMIKVGQHWPAMIAC
jgi:hypothetical protein